MRAGATGASLEEKVSRAKFLAATRRADTGRDATADGLDRELPAQLRIAVMRLARRLRQQTDGTLTPSQLSALSSVHKLGPLTLGELAGVERVRPPSMTRIVAALEEAGLVTREPDPRDRRVCRVRASAAGATFLARERTRRDAFLAERLRLLAPDDLAALARTLPVLEALAGDPHAGAAAVAP
ncbi:MAG TPA: MarR family transcriptional regulator [Actinomycetes bacterium]|nr:MarR family transcriptional regulator [Actinomycetes bacterium]